MGNLLFEKLYGNKFPAEFRNEFSSINNCSHKYDGAICEYLKSFVSIILGIFSKETVFEWVTQRNTMAVISATKPYLNMVSFKISENLFRIKD